MKEISVERLWQDYLFLSQEMNKFAGQRNHDMVFALLEEREKLQALIDSAPGAAEYKASQEGRQLLMAVRQENVRMTAQMRLQANQMRQEQSMSEAYDPYSAMGQVGRRMDRQS